MRWNLEFSSQWSVESCLFFWLTFLPVLKSFIVFLGIISTEVEECFPFFSIGFLYGSRSMQNNGCGCELPWTKEKMDVIILNNLCNYFVIN